MLKPNYLMKIYKMKNLGNLARKLIKREFLISLVLNLKINEWDVAVVQ